MTSDVNVPAVAETGPAADAEVARIERPTLHSAVVSRLRDMITEGQLPPGVRIHEGQLGKQLGVSRTPLREALKVMASEGLVDLVPSRGALVRNLTPKDVKDMLAVLAALEELAGRLACSNATDEVIAEVTSSEAFKSELTRRGIVARAKGDGRLIGAVDVIGDLLHVRQ